MAEAKDPTSRPDPTATAHSTKPKRTPEARQILDDIEKVWGRPLKEHPDTHCNRGTSQQYHSCPGRSEPEHLTMPTWSGDVNACTVRIA